MKRFTPVYTTISTVCLILLIGVMLPAQLAKPQSCLDRTVTDEAELNTAIEAYNSECGSGDILTVTIADTVTLSSDTTPVDNDVGAKLRLTGGGTVDGAGSHQILEIDNGNVVVANLTLRRGHVGAGSAGGALANNDTLTIKGVTVSNNASESDGGALFNRGTIEAIDDTQFSDNSANLSGGAIVNAGTIKAITNSTFSSNSAQFSGAIANDQVITEIANATFVNNSASDRAGAINNIGTLDRIADTTFTGNSVEAGTGGAIVNAGTIRTIGQTTFSDNAARVGDPATAIDEGLGGALENPGRIDEIANTTFSNNSAAEGGAIHNNGEEIGTIRKSILTGNSASRQGGAILNVVRIGEISKTTLTDNSANAFGGAVGNTGWIETLQDSTFSGNATTDGVGGAIALNTGRINALINVTLSNNSAEFGGAISNRLGGKIGLTHATLFNNEASDSGGAIFNGNNAQLTVRNSLVANSGSGDNCFNKGAFNTEDANLDSDGSCPGFTVSSVDPQLGPLADNGGPTKTHGLRPNSPAIDAAQGCPPPETDQRGVQRPDGEACDLGALEYRPESTAGQANHEAKYSYRKLKTTILNTYIAK